MNIKSPIIIALLILSIIFISGCTSNVNVDANNGIVINEFSADPVTAEPDDMVNFFLDIENVGGTTAKCISAELFGAESWYDATGQPLSGGMWANRGLNFNYINGNVQFSYWDANSGSSVNLMYNRDYGTSFSSYMYNSWNNFADGFCNANDMTYNGYDMIKYWPEMSPPYPDRNRPGQSFTTMWSLKPPILPEGVRTTYPITARVSYLYTTTAQVNVFAYNKAESKRMTDLGQAPLEYTIDNSQASPIKISLERATSPIIVNDNQPGAEFANYLITLQNVGNGWPLQDNDLSNGFMFAVLELNGPGAYFYDCLGYNSGTEALMYGDYIQNLVKLRSDKTAKFGCTIGLDRSQWINNPMGTISLTFRIFYRYYTDSQTSVTVLGQERYA
jgi:hypothetical protein